MVASNRDSMRMAARLVERGVERQSAGFLSEAVVLWRAALKINPTDERARSYLAWAEASHATAEPSPFEEEQATIRRSAPPLQRGTSGAITPVGGMPTISATRPGSPSPSPSPVGPPPSSWPGPSLDDETGNHGLGAALPARAGDAAASALRTAPGAPPPPPGAPAPRSPFGLAPAPELGMPPPGPPPPGVTSTRPGAPPPTPRGQHDVTPPIGMPQLVRQTALPEAGDRSPFEVEPPVPPVATPRRGASRVSPLPPAPEPDSTSAYEEPIPILIDTPPPPPPAGVAPPPAPPKSDAAGGDDEFVFIDPLSEGSGTWPLPIAVPGSQPVPSSAAAPSSAASDAPPPSTGSAPASLPWGEPAGAPRAPGSAPRKLPAMALTPAGVPAVPPAAPRAVELVADFEDEQLAAANALAAEDLPDPLDQARAAFQRGDIDGAWRAAEERIAAVGGPNAPELLVDAPLLEWIYAQRCRPMDKIAVVAGVPSELDLRTAYLLSRIDGNLTLEDLVDVSGMSRLEALRMIAQLVAAGLITRR